MLLVCFGPHQWRRGGKRLYGLQSIGIACWLSLSEVGHHVDYVVLASPWGSVSYWFLLLNWASVHEVLLAYMHIRGNGFSLFTVLLLSEALLVPQKPQVARLFLIVLGTVSKVLVESVLYVVRLLLILLLVLGSQVAGLRYSGIFGL